MKNRIWEIHQGLQEISEIVSETGGKKYIISGAFTTTDKPNGNNRIYPKGVMQEAINSLRTKVTQKRVRMCLDHPSMSDWGIPKLKECAAIITEISDVNDQGIASYKAQIVDTQVGKDLKAILDAGGQIGVSTRGFGDSKKEQTYPGFGDAKFEVITKFDLKSIDFVDDPSVSCTEELMQLESLKRSETMENKSFYDQKKNYPEIIGQFETKIADEKKALEEKITSIATASEKQIASLVEAVKSVKPEAFVTTTVPETDVIKAANAKIVTLEAEVQKHVKESETLKKEIETLMSEQTKMAKDKEISKLRSEDAVYFGHDVLVKKFEVCTTADEVRKVYESNKELLTALTAAQAPVPPKTETPVPAKKDGLTEAQKKEFDTRNSQRMSAGMVKLSESDFIKKFVK